MKTIILLSLLFVVAGCTHDEVPDPFGQFEDYAEFSLNGKKIKLATRASSTRGLNPIMDEAEKIDSIKIVVGRSVSKDGVDEPQLKFSILKTFLAEDFGINPDEYDNTEIEVTAQHLYAVFSEPGDIRDGFLSGFFNKSRDGVYLVFFFDGEQYTALPKVEIDNQQKLSVFQYQRGHSNAFDNIKVEMSFDVYMKGQTSGNVIHLENGKFIASYQWGDF